jgi:hypothetical protein
MTICCWHVRPGMSGLMVGIGFFLLVWLYAYLQLRKEKAETFTFTPPGQGSFLPLLEKYVWLSQFVIGLASGSILLLAGTSIFKSSAKLPWEFASPVVLLALSVVYGVSFLAFLFRDYESFLHGLRYTRAAYTRNIALGFSSLLSFGAGYLWMAFCLSA